jgi:hypothetical protein
MGAFILIAAAFLSNPVDINDPLRLEGVLPRLMITTLDKWLVNHMNIGPWYTDDKYGQG